jgi:hypothetical protein
VTVPSSSPSTWRAETPPPDPEPVRSERSRRRQLVAAAAVLAAATAAAGFAVLRREPGRAIPALAYTAHPASGASEIWRLDDRGRPVRVSAPGEVAFAPAWSPCGARLAYVSNDPRAGFTVHVVDGAVRHDVAQSAGPVSDIGWTPDGKALVFPRVTGPGQDLAVLDLATGTTRVIVHRDEVTIGQVAVNPVSGRLAISEVKAGGPGEIRLLEPDGTRAGDPIPGLSPAWSPDGSALAFITEGLSGWTLSVRTGETTRPVFSSARLLYNPAWVAGGRTIVVERTDPDGSRIWTVDAGRGTARQLRVPGVANVGTPAARPGCS